jgi:hypothetical protein
VDAAVSVFSVSACLAAFSAARRLRMYSRAEATRRYARAPSATVVPVLGNPTNPALSEFVSRSSQAADQWNL